MNIDTSGILYKQARRQAIWAGVWLVLAVIAVIVRKDAEGPQQWIVDQVIILAGLLMFFQFGRMFQGLFFLRMNIASSLPRVFGQGGPVDQDATVQPVSATGIPELSSADFQKSALGRDIRSFASIDEARSYGWEFGEALAKLGDQPVPSTATYAGVSYKYDGLATERMMGAVPANSRVFGRLTYKQIEPASPPRPSGPMIASV